MIEVAAHVLVHDGEMLIGSIGSRADLVRDRRNKWVVDRPLDDVLRAGHAV